MSGVHELGGVLTGWRTCPRCSHQLDVAPEHAGERASARCPGCGSRYYDNPAPTASVLATRASDGKLLLVRRGIEPYKGFWDTPGGFVDPAEHVEAGALRELREETGLEGELVDFLGGWPDVYGDSPAATLNLFWTARVADDSVAAPASDVAEIAWFAPDALPQMEEIAFGCVPLVLAEWRRRAAGQ